MAGMPSPEGWGVGEQWRHCQSPQRCSFIQRPFHSLFRNPCVCYFHLFLFPWTGMNENHKKVAGINKRQTRAFSSLDSSPHVAEGPVDLLIIVKAS